MDKQTQYNEAYKDIMQRQRTVADKQRMALARIGVAYETLQHYARSSIVTREELNVWYLYLNRLIYDLASRYHLIGSQVEEYLARNYGTKTIQAEARKDKQREKMRNTALTKPTEPQPEEKETEPQPEYTMTKPVPQELLHLEQLLKRLRGAALMKSAEFKPIEKEAEEHPEHAVVKSVPQELLQLEQLLMRLQNVAPTKSAEPESEDKGKIKKEWGKSANSTDLFTIPAETMDRYISTIKDRLVNGKLKGLMPYLKQFFTEDELLQLIDRYRLGCLHKDRIVYPFYDIEGRLRVMRTVKYDEKGKRTKNGISSAHPFLKAMGILSPHWKEKACIFGEHLLTEHPDKPVVVVSGEKMAIIGSLLLPSCIWLAMGGDAHFKELELIKEHLNSRNVYLLPGKGKCQYWFKEAKRYHIKGRVLDYIDRASIDEDTNPVEWCLLRHREQQEPHYKT